MTLALDAPAVETSGGTLPLTITLPAISAGASVLVAIDAFATAPVFSVSSPHITFTQRATAQDAGGSHLLFTFEGVATSSLSGEVITIALTGGSLSFCEAFACSFVGENQSTPFDNGGASNVPVQGTVDPLINTNNANTLCFTILYTSGNTGAVANTGWTKLWDTTSGFANLFGAYKIVSTAQTNLGSSMTGDTIVAAIGDAIQIAGAAAVANRRMLMGVGS